MPTFDNVEINTTANIDFEVYCGTCGKGLCGESDTRRSNSRGYLQVTVNACPYCIEEKDAQIYDLEEKIKSLEEELEKKI